MHKNKIKILDCTIRDGGYLNKWNFSKKMVREVYRAVSKAGVDIIEIGYRYNRGHLSNNCGLWQSSSEEDLREVTSGIDGAKIAVMVDVGKATIDDFLDAKDSKISMVRVAAHKNKIEEAFDFINQLKAKRYKTSFQAMGFTTYSEKDKDFLANIVKGSGADYLYIADSYGSMYPDSIKDIFSPFMHLKERGIKIGFHPHNNLQMAFANTLAAISCGVDIVDASVYGMGRGAGNLPLETIVSNLQISLGFPKYNVVPILSCIDRYFVEIKKETPWGYKLPYMISGVMGCHPSYARKLVDLREYAVEDIWKALEFIKDLNPVGFNEEIVNRIVHTGLVSPKITTKSKQNKDSNTIRNGNSKPKYINQHKGKDFLILANGPTLKENRKDIEKFISQYKPIILGANYLGGLFKPHYHAFTNKKRFIEYIDVVERGSSLLLGSSLSEEFIREYTKRDYEVLEYIDTLDSDFDIVDGVIQANCRSVAVFLLGVAVVMGAERIFAAGLDGYVNATEKSKYHFYNETGEPESRKVILERHYWNEHFIRQIDEYFCNIGGEGIHILTPTGYKAFHKSLHNYITQDAL